jgi:hypothetical protein
VGQKPGGHLVTSAQGGVSDELELDILIEEKKNLHAYLKNYEKGNLFFIYLSLYL